MSGNWLESTRLGVCVGDVRWCACWSMVEVRAAKTTLTAGDARGADA